MRQRVIKRAPLPVLREPSVQCDLSAPEAATSGRERVHDVIGDLTKDASCSMFLRRPTIASAVDHQNVDRLRARGM
jgi:hypothetical protein